jgi:hypothetical protein
MGFGVPVRDIPVKMFQFKTFRFKTFQMRRSISDVPVEAFRFTDDPDLGGLDS